MFKPTTLSLYCMKLLKMTHAGSLRLCQMAPMLERAAKLDRYIVFINLVVIFNDSICLFFVCLFLVMKSLKWRLCFCYT